MILKVCHKQIQQINCISLHVSTLYSYVNCKERFIGIYLIETKVLNIFYLSLLYNVHVFDFLLITVK